MFSNSNAHLSFPSHFSLETLYDSKSVVLFIEVLKFSIIFILIWVPMLFSLFSVILPLLRNSVLYVLVWVAWLACLCTILSDVGSVGGVLG